MLDKQAEKLANLPNIVYFMVVVVPILSLLIGTGLWIKYPHPFAPDPLTIQSRFREKLLAKSSYWQEPRWTICEPKAGEFAVTTSYENLYNVTVEQLGSSPVVQVQQDFQPYAMVASAHLEGGQVVYQYDAPHGNEQEKELLRTITMDAISAFQESL